MLRSVVSPRSTRMPVASVVTRDAIQVNWTQHSVFFYLLHSSYVKCAAYQKRIVSSHRLFSPIECVVAFAKI